MRRWLFSAIFALVVAGCAILPPLPYANPHNYVLLIPGQSTIDDAIYLLGPPVFYTPLSQGKISLQWADYYEIPRLHIAIMFGIDRKLIEIRHIII